MSGARSTDLCRDGYVDCLALSEGQARTHPQWYAGGLKVEDWYIKYKMSVYVCPDAHPALWLSPPCHLFAGCVGSGGSHYRLLVRSRRVLYCRRNVIHVLALFVRQRVVAFRNGLDGAAASGIDIVAQLDVDLDGLVHRDLDPPRVVSPATPRMAGGYMVMHAVRNTRVNKSSFNRGAP
jgi:hypothetical protein